MEKSSSSLFFILIFMTTCYMYSQENNRHPRKSYTEFNVGFATNKHWEKSGGVMPGASYLFGKTHYYKSGLIIDNQIGFALPVILTAKIGGGFKLNETEFISGIRIWPMNYFTQINTPFKKGKLVLTVERFMAYNDTMFPNNYFSVGYRWHKK